MSVTTRLKFSFEEDEGRREWMFAEIGKIATITEKGEKGKTTRESI